MNNYNLNFIDHFISQLVEIKCGSGLGKAGAILRLQSNVVTTCIIHLLYSPEIVAQHTQQHLIVILGECGALCTDIGDQWLVERKRKRKCL